MITKERKTSTTDSIEVILPLVGALAGYVGARAIGIDPNLGGFIGTVGGREASIQMSMIPGGRTQDTYSVGSVVRAWILSVGYPGEKKGQL